MRWEDICTGWTTCRTISRNHLQPYNYSFLLAEGLITIVIISIPAVQKALGRVKKIAVE